MKRSLFVAILFTILIFMLLPIVSAKQGHMKLLAVKETEKGYEGGIADLYLEIRPGSGRVFLETRPLTRTDTQMSTRFAKAIACDMLDKDCDDIDFFYTITADSAIIAGPSAGASIAVLTAAMLEDLEMNKDYAITGTINSGGLIGPVGGLKAKIEAAKQFGITKVMIPAGEMVVRLDNTTIDLENLSMELGIEIMEISTITDAVREFTGKEIKQEYSNIDIDDEYVQTMKFLAEELCQRTRKLESVANRKFPINVSQSKENAKNLTRKGQGAFQRNAYYSAASFCFGANVEYTYLDYISKNFSSRQLSMEIQRLSNEIEQLESKIQSIEKKTITDLEAYMVVKERLVEAKTFLLQAIDQTNRSENFSMSFLRTVAYASERINSAKSWSNFFGKPGKVFNLNKDILRDSCQDKISEATERMQYVELYIPNTLSNVKEEIERASSELQSGSYELCLSTASKAKADVDIILGIFGVESSQYSNILDRKLDVVKNNIARQASDGIFPILGYSYYEYANSLKDSDLFSALLYSEYALELGNLDIYFKEAKRKNLPVVDKKSVGIFLSGIITGALAVALIPKKRSKRRA